jgi:hypothetical protein
MSIASFHLGVSSETYAAGSCPEASGFRARPRPRFPARVERLEHFQAGWKEPAARKMRQNKGLERLA